MREWLVRDGFAELLDAGGAAPAVAPDSRCAISIKSVKENMKSVKQSLKKSHLPKQVCLVIGFSKYSFSISVSLSKRVPSPKKSVTPRNFFVFVSCFCC